jgi:DNA-binding NarL/FixJ family response regulator
MNCIIVHVPNNKLKATLIKFKKLGFEEPSPNGNENSILQILSPRETQVLRLIRNGFTNVEIAKKLRLSKRTVDTHREAILRKTKSKNTASLFKAIDVKKNY